MTTEQKGQLDHRVYRIADCVTFRKTKEAFGGLSNMAAGYPLVVSGIPMGTSEALYQACRFPHMPDLQEVIIRQSSPMTAKMRSKPFRGQSRKDWEAVKVRVMRWCLRVKLSQHWTKFEQLILSTDDKPIVEFSMKDTYWGAQPVEGEDGVLSGANVLGRLLMELRVKLRGPEREALREVEPLALENALLIGRPIERVTGPTRPDPSLFRGPVPTVTPPEDKSAAKPKDSRKTAPKATPERREPMPPSSPRTPPVVVAAAPGEVPEWCFRGGHIRFHDRPRGWYRAGREQRWRMEELVPYGKVDAGYRAAYYTCPECRTPVLPLVEPKYKFQCSNCKLILSWSFGALMSPGGVGHPAGSSS